MMVDPVHAGSTEPLPDRQRDLESLLLQQLPALRAYLRLKGGMLVRQLDTSSDILQSVCREILAHRDRFRHGSEEGVRRWMYATALRKVISRQRYHQAGKRHHGRAQALPTGSSLGSSAEILSCYASLVTPSRVAEAREELERIEHAFDQLTSEQRTVLLLAGIVGLSHEQIATELGKSEGAVHKLVARARAKLAMLLIERRRHQSSDPV